MNIKTNIHGMTKEELIYDLVKAYIIKTGDSETSLRRAKYAYEKLKKEKIVKEELPDEIEI